MRKSFTVIELLVVVSVIGFLSSVVLVGIKGSREKAEIARSLQFSHSIKNALGAYILGEWNFEESGDDTCPTSDPDYNDICDTSGNDNHGKNNNHNIIRDSSEIRELGKVGIFGNGSHPYSYYFEVLESSSLKTLNGFDRVVTEVWLKPEQTDYYYGIFRNPNFYLHIEDNDIDFGVWYDNGNVDSKEYSSGLEIDKWAHIVISYDISKEIAKVFINGEEDNILVLDDGEKMGTVVDPVGLHVGAKSCRVDNVRVYSESLTSAQIKKHYAEGLKKRGLVLDN